MFFIMGISTAEKKLDFVQTMVCFKCGQYGRYELYMTYTYLSLFFIPIFKWNKQYYVKSTCCNTVYAIDKELGKKIQNGEQILLNEQDLHIINYGNQNYGNQNYNNNNYNNPSSDEVRCSNCGYVAKSEFTFCPKCGNRL